VELVGRYSNPDEWGHLTDTTLALAEPAAGEASDMIVVAPSGARRPWPVTGRLGGEATVQELLGNRRAGVMQRVLAERYGISVSSVKQILRSNPH
jgi:hypothetical protein